MHRLIQNLMNEGWHVKSSDTLFALPEDVFDRYSPLPSEIGNILAGVDECVAPDEKAWLLCLPDFMGESKSAFAWNEFEKQSLEVATGNTEWQKEIAGFWSRHFPVFISVRNGYEYAAVCLDEECRGQVVTGSEPEYEEATVSAASFSDYVAALR